MCNPGQWMEPDEVSFDYKRWWKIIEKTTATIIVILGILLGIWCVFHFAFMCGYQTRCAELGTLDSLEQRGIISPEGE